MHYSVPNMSFKKKRRRTRAVSFWGAMAFVDLFYSPFANCYLQLNQPCVPLFSLFMVLSLTTNALLTPCLFLSFHCCVTYTPTDMNTRRHRHTSHKHAETSCLSDWNSWNKHVECAALRGRNQILSTTNTVEERIWWTDGKSGSGRHAARCDPGIGLPSLII